MDYPPERIQIKTDKLDETAWQQIIVSWDLSTDPQRIGLLVNGSGQVINLPAGTFKPGRFLSMEFGNRPSTWEVPYLPMDGAIKKIGIYDASIF
ncbi:hypothetical protein RZS08_30055, partial [Arthrospira platensis SPKY1]|nr:hypothetical protein [Arthrospira platensis SPKY1]